MTEYEEKKCRLIYEQNITMSNVVTLKSAEESNKGETLMKYDDCAFKQQYNLKLRGLFEEQCHDMNINGFEYSDNNENGTGNAGANAIRSDGGNYTVSIRGKKKTDTRRLSNDEMKRFDVDKCYGCGNYYVAGLNMKVRVEYANHGKRGKMASNKVEKATKVWNGTCSNDKKNSTRSVCMECLICGVVTVYEGVLEKDGRDSENLEKAEAAAHLPLNTLPLVSGAVGKPTDSREEDKKKDIGNNSCKSKSKKKNKQMSLKGLLSVKREAEARARDGRGGVADISSLFL